MSNEAPQIMPHPGRLLSNPSPEQPSSQWLKREEELDKIDEEIVRAMTALFDVGQHVRSFSILSVIAGRCDWFIFGLTNLEKCAAFLKDNAEIDQKLQAAWKARSFRDILQLPELRTQQDPESEEQGLVMHRSWMGEYRGEVADDLWGYIMKSFALDDVDDYYTTIVQSSGMGKSRAVDELSKKHFVIPVCLREPDAAGFPPADHQARDFLTRYKGLSKQEVFKRMLTFLTALFDKVAEVVEEIYAESHVRSHEDLARLFRLRMTDGQSAQRCNEYRTRFYGDVVRRATTVTFAKDKPSSGPESPEELLKKACPLLINTLAKKWPGAKREPQLILALDEAHVLYEAHGWTNYEQFRRALRILSNAPLFTLFISPTYILTQPKPTPKSTNDPSMRIMDMSSESIEPFTVLDFDLFADKANIRNLSLEDVTKEQFMVKFGRPLFASRLNVEPSCPKDIVKFAASKLLHVTNVDDVEILSGEQMLACFCQRIPLKFHSTTFRLLEEEMFRVKAHMRVCQRVSADMTELMTDSPSEPILSEAAFAIMQRDDFDAPVAFQEVLSTSGIYKGFRGELVVLLFLTLSRDTVVRQANDDEMWTKMERRPESEWNRVVSVEQFIRNLFRIEEQNDYGAVAKGLFDEFKDSELHFNHFIKVDEPGVVNVKYVPQLMLRGAAFLCTKLVQGVDVVIPASRDGNKMILVQVENDGAYGAYVDPRVFEEMDPAKLRIGELTAVIRIVFALASNEAKLHIESHVLKYKSGKRCRAYDIWCAGLSPEILGAVTVGNQAVWEALCEAGGRWRNLYKEDGKDVGSRMHMTPGVASYGAFLSNWCAEDNDESK